LKKSQSNQKARTMVSAPDLWL